jgi:hypothetical protein
MTCKFGMELRSVWLLRKCGKRHEIKMEFFLVPRYTAIWFNLDESLTVHEVHYSLYC